MQYGYDLGKVPSSSEWNGFASKSAELYDKFGSKKGDYVRLFLFCDLRSSINFDATGTPLSFTDYVYEDMRALLDAAKVFNIQLMPVLFDYGIADGKTEENGFVVGEHADLITDASKKEALLDLFASFFAEFAGDPNIYAWDIINEPEYASAVTMGDTQDFVEDFTSLIHAIAPAAQVTVGSRNRSDMVNYWTNSGLDIYQFHYYDSHEGSYSLDYDAFLMGLDKPVIAGELEPTSISYKLDMLELNGYAGGLLWEDGSGYIIGDDKYDELCNWFDGTTVGYGYYASGRKHTETWNNGMVREFEDALVFEDGNGRIVKETYLTGGYKLYEYNGSAITPFHISFYLSDDTLCMQEEYDEDGNMTATSEYYANGQAKLIINADGSWISYDEDENILNTGTILDAVEIIYDSEGRIEKLIKGSYIEERQYIFYDGVIIYTLAIHNDVIKAAIEGLSADAQFMSLEETSDTANAISVTYDNNITVSYVDDRISALSVENGYMNFYNEDAILSQNNAAGDLYSFENNFLKLVATASGNIYEFENCLDASGTIVTLQSAVIDGVLYDYPADKDALKTAIAGEIPNVEFVYDTENNIEMIKTSGYCEIYFENERILATVTPDGQRVDYEYVTDSQGEIIQLLMSEGGEDGAVRTFDVSGNLLTLAFLEGGEIIRTLTYQDGALIGVDTSQGDLRDIVFGTEGDIEAVRLVKPDGFDYFFVGGRLKDFLDEQNVDYLVNEYGDIYEIHRRDTGERFSVENYTIDGSKIDKFMSLDTGTEYIYIDELLDTALDPSGMEIYFKDYDELYRYETVEIWFGNKKNATYTYDYTEEGTVIMDDLGNKRTYDVLNNPLTLETPYNDIYGYGTYVDENDNTLTFVNYTVKIKGEGDDRVEIYYSRGKIDKIVYADESWIDNIEFDQLTQKLHKFTLHTADGKVRNAILEGDFMILEMEDSTQLIFQGNELVAFASSQGVVPLKDGMDIDGIFVGTQPDESGSGSSENIDIAASNWRHQTFEDTQAIRFVERDYVNDEWKLSVDLRPGDSQYSQGEMYLDLRYDIPGIQWQGPFDMTDKEISFKFKLDDNFEQNPNYLSSIQVFVKDENFNTQYGTEVELVKSGDWIEVSLIPTEDNINFGYTDLGFDPSKIVMIGLRIAEPENAPANLNYLGNIYIKHNMIPEEIFANANYETSPLDDLYYDLGISRNLKILTNDGEQLDIEEYLVQFAGALEGGPSNTFQESLLRGISWHPETECDHIQSVKSVYRDSDTDEIVLNMRLSSEKEEYGEGEVYFNVASDIPGLGWGSSMNLVSRPIKILIEVPEGALSSTDAPTGARIFVEDDNFGLQYGTWINLKEGEKWYELELTPTFGIPSEGSTTSGFDPSKITKIGVNIATQDGSEVDFEGEVRLAFLPCPSGTPEEVAIDMPLWMDLRNIREYILDENENYINVPYVNYLSEELFSYVFNKGSGEEPAIDFSILESSGTVWQSQDTGSSPIRSSDVYWNAAGDELVYNLTSMSREFILDTQYNCWVPGKNWQGPIDMTKAQITFYVRPQEETDAVFSISAFAKDSSWKSERSLAETFEGSGEWGKVTLTPISTKFIAGYTDNDFDPESLAILGLNIQVVSGSYSGPIEIRYEINDLDLGVSDLDNGGQLPASPVWTNIRDLADYIKENEITFSADTSILEQIRKTAAEIQTYCLPSDFVAFTVFDEDENLVSITKPNQTTTYFNESSQVDYITFEDGSIFVDYEYDEDGNLVDACLVDAREELEESLDDACREIDLQMADMLLLLEAQKILISEDMRNELNETRAEIAALRAQLEAMRYVKVKHSKVVWILFIPVTVVWYETYEVPGVKEQIDVLNDREQEFIQQVKDALDNLDAEIDAKKAEVEAEKETIISAYEWQAKKMLLGIMHEEAIPVIHYYYREILGRDVTEEEISAIFKRINENNSFAGFFEEDFLDLEGILTLIKNDTTYPVYLLLSEDSRTFVDSFNPGDEIDNDTLTAIINDFDSIVQKNDLYQSLIAYYGIQEALDALLSDTTKAYRDGLACLDKPEEELTDEETTEIQWLNRYILQDIYGSILAKDQNSPVFNAVNLKEELKASTEYTNSATFKTNVIARIKDFLDYYISNPSERSALLSDLGLSEGDVITVSDTFKTALYDWLDNQEVHFGRSAFGALQKMLTGQEITDIDIVELATKALLMDIMLGITGPMSDEDIKISMYTMDHIAGLYGLDCYSVRLDYDDISQIVAPFVTLINTYHYVTVLEVTSDSVTYWDANIGENGSELTISKKDFTDNWQGNVITARPEDENQRVDESKIISDEAAKKIKGSFWFLIPLLGFIFSAVSAVVTAAVAVISAIIAGITSFVAAVVAGISQALAYIGGILKFAGDAFLGALGLGGAGAATAGAVATEAATVGSLLVGLASKAIPTVIQIGVAYTVSTGLDALGVDPLVSGLISAIVTGGVYGLMPSGGGTLYSAFTNALKYGATAGIGIIGEYFDFDPIITNILSLATSALIGVGTGDMEFSEALDFVRDNVVYELTAYGVEQLGDYLDLDPRITYLAGIGIRSSLRMGFSTGGGDPGAMFVAAVEGAMNGATRLGLNYLLDTLDLPPYLAQMGYEIVDTFANALFPGTRILEILYNSYNNHGLTHDGRPDKSDDKYWTEDLETGEKIFDLDAYSGDMADWAWKEQGYKSMAKAFEQHIQDVGLDNAIDLFKLDLLDMTTIGVMEAYGMTAGTYLLGKIEAGDYGMAERLDGTQFAVVDITDTEGTKVGEAYFKYSESAGTWTSYAGYSTDGYEIYGDSYVDVYGRIRWNNADIREQAGSYTLIQRIRDGYQVHAEVQSADGMPLFVFSPDEGTGYNWYSVDGEYVNVRADVGGFSLIFNNGELTYEDIGNGVTWSVNSDGNIDVFFNSNSGMSYNQIQMWGSLTQEQLAEGMTALMFFGNGFGNEGAEGEMPAIMQSFKNDLINDGIISPDNTFGMTAYEGTDSCWGLMRNAGIWTLDAMYDFYNPITDEIINELDTWMTGLTPEQQAARKIYFSHSGQFRPLIGALNEREDFDIHTIINYEGPFPPSTQQVIDNPNIKRIINVIGTKGGAYISSPSDFVQLGAFGIYFDLRQLGFVDDPVPFLGDVNFVGNDGQGNTWSIENINFEILGAGHNDFSYNPANPDEVRRATNYFMRELSEASMSDIRLSEFVMKNGIFYDDNRNIYVVDPIFFESENR